ncbi:hypothetical protein JDV02_004340 [Purpureocillium takamizusanense]|uniref:Uncharacterized protein n=1 Tax=Purpureocillium takamizusanense TaxID=2060973 RepID=A0A9Q8QEI8_9HYPO|nr:uncharacterized protein JDV02_004340 [Purpureocillium takamizusanense]UNI18043.1 hypothetical protein JDV02_004340 [Purpureocillium takamizusanense]
MEDQFGGRTDDDLFYDDFEPVDSEPIVVPDDPQPPPQPAPAPEQQQQKQAPGRPQLAAAAAPPAVPSSASKKQTQPTKKPATAKPAAKSAPPTKIPPSLATSRWADKPAATTTTATPTTKASSPAPLKDSTAADSRPSATPTSSSTPPRDEPSAPSLAAAPTSGSAPTEPPAEPPNTTAAAVAAKSQSATAGTSSTTAPPPASSGASRPAPNTAANAEARLKSGANPRQKLTDTELAAKMERMKLLAAEQTRKFEMSQKDQRQHAESYARGMEEARKRRVEDAERRRRADEDRRRLDDERARNRERKLKAMGAKEGGWDEGKLEAQEEEDRKGFRGANGGVRGVRREGGGLGGSRYAARDGDNVPDVDRFLDDRYRGDRGGRGGRGGAGRGGAGRGGRQQPSPAGGKPANAAAPSLGTDEFPALPSDGKKAGGGGSANLSQGTAVPTPPALPSPPAVGKWDDEMEALDELKEHQQGK